MRMRSEVKNFIEKYIELVREEDFSQLYIKATKELGSYVGELTRILLDIDIDPLDYLDYIPENFLRGDA